MAVLTTHATDLTHMFTVLTYSCSTGARDAGSNFWISGRKPTTSLL